MKTIMVDGRANSGGLTKEQLVKTLKMWKITCNKWSWIDTKTENLNIKMDRKNKWSVIYYFVKLRAMFSTNENEDIVLSWSPEDAVQPPVAAGNPSTPTSSSVSAAGVKMEQGDTKKTNQQRKKDTNAHFSNPPYTSKIQNTLVFPEIYTSISLSLLCTCFPPDAE